MQLYIQTTDDKEKNIGAKYGYQDYTTEKPN